MWKDTCHKCGTKIFNGIPEERMDNPQAFIDEMEKQGYILGYNTKTVGYFGHLEHVPMQPICSNCSNEQHKNIEKKTVAKQMRKIIPTLKKIYICPFNDVPFRECSYKTEIKAEMIMHLELKHTSELDRVVL